MAVIALTSPLERLSDQMYMIIMVLVWYQRIKHLLILVVVFVLNWSLLCVHRISVDIFTRKRLSLEQAKKTVLYHIIGLFRVPRTLTFKTRLGAQPILWKWVLFAWEWKMISQGHPTTIFGKISVRNTIWDLEFSEHLL